MNGHDIVTIFHKVDGPCELTALDAVAALRHPEWSREPWPGQKSGHGLAARLPAGATHLAKPEGG